MAVTVAAPDDEVASALWNEVAGLINGTSGYGNPAKFYRHNDSASYSVIAGNVDTTNGLAFKAQWGPVESPTTIATFKKSGVDIVGDLTVSGTITSGGGGGGGESFPAGTVGSPGLYVDSDTDTGLYAPAANNLAVTTGGAQRLLVNSSGVTVTGTLGATAISSTGAITSSSNIGGVNVSASGSLVGAAAAISGATSTATLSSTSTVSLIGGTPLLNNLVSSTSPNVEGSYNPSYPSYAPGENTSYGGLRVYSGGSVGVAGAGQSTNETFTVYNVTNRNHNMVNFDWGNEMYGGDNTAMYVRATQGRVGSNTKRGFGQMRTAVFAIQRYPTVDTTTDGGTRGDAFVGIGSNPVGNITNASQGTRILELGMATAVARSGISRVDECTGIYLGNQAFGQISAYPGGVLTYIPGLKGNAGIFIHGTDNFEYGLVWGTPDAQRRGVNQIQRVTTNGNSGNIVLSFGAGTCAPFAWNASASTVVTALEAASTIGVGDVAVEKVTDGDWKVTFQNVLSATPHALMVWQSADGGDTISGSVFITLFQQGSSYGYPDSYVSTQDNGTRVAPGADRQKPWFALKERGFIGSYCDPQYRLHLKSNTATEVSTWNYPTITTETTMIQVEMDSAAVVPAHIVAAGLTASTKQLRLGYNTTSDYGSVQAINNSTPVTLTLQPGGGKVGVGTTSVSGRLQVLPLAAEVGLIVQGNTSQSAHLQDWTNIGGSVLSYVRNDGLAKFAGVATSTQGTAPIDGDFASTPPEGTLVGYFDGSNYRLYIRLNNAFHYVTLT